MSATLPITANDRTVTRIASVAGQVAFTFDFPIQAAGDLSVSAAASATPTLFVPLSFAAGDYTVTGVGAAGGGSVVLATGRGLGDAVRIEGDADIARTSSVTRGGAYRSAAIDADLDRLVIVAQELRRDVDRSGAPLAVEAAASAALSAAAAESALEQIHETSVANGAVTTVKLADGAVTTAKLAANSVTPEKIAPNSIPVDRLNAILPVILEQSIIPAAFVAPVIILTLPHFRQFVWAGGAYVRAPWHRPAVVSYGYTATPPLGLLEVRADVTHAQGDYPDLASELGIAVGATFTFQETRGEFIRVWDNSRGVDTGRNIRTTQADAFKSHTHSGQIGTTINNVAVAAGIYVVQSDGVTGIGYTGGSETRPRNVSLPLWISY